MLTITAIVDSASMTPMVKPSGIVLSTVRVVIARFPLVSIAVTL